MQKNKPFRILAGLDLTAMDQYIIQYVHHLAQTFDIKSVTFLHNIKLEDLTKEFLSTTVLNDIYQKVKTKLHKKVEKVGVDFTYQIVVRMEAFSEAAFERLYKRDPFDLLVIGRKRGLDGNGSLSHKLVQLFPGSTLIVPQIRRTPIKKIVEAITFSKYTPSILEWGNRLRENQLHEEVEFLPVHISKPFYTSLIRRGYETDQVFQTDIKIKREKWNELYRENGDLEVLSCEDESIATALLKFMEEKDGDILILGVKGESRIREVFMGSVANDLLFRSMDIALLFVKP